MMDASSHAAEGALMDRQAFRLDTAKFASIVAMSDA
jgi:uncharacterized protein (DUF1778 family)